MAKAFSVEEKRIIREKLIEECEANWIKYGYKKTSIDTICREAGISKGAFYIFYDSKELLFCDVIDRLQEKLIRFCKESLVENSTKEDFSNVFKQIYREYDQGNWVINFGSPDYQALMNRIPPDRLKQHSHNSTINFHEIISKTNIKYKIEEDKAIGIFNALLSLLSNKDKFGYNHYEIFCFLLDNTLDEIFE